MSGNFINIGTDFIEISEIAAISEVTRAVEIEIQIAIVEKKNGKLLEIPLPDGKRLSDYVSSERLNIGATA